MARHRLAPAKQPGICRDAVPDVQSRRHRPTDSSARRHETRRASGRALTPRSPPTRVADVGRAPCAIWLLDASRVDDRRPSAGTAVLVPARFKAQRMPFALFPRDSEVPHRNLIECSRLSTPVDRSLLRAGTRSRLLRQPASPTVAPVLNRRPVCSRANSSFAKWVAAA
jgi:hypothetical protein